MGEAAKLRVRQALHRGGIELARDPYVNRLVRALGHAGVTTVLDVGANVGQYASMLRSAGFDGRILSLEPLQDAHASLAARAASDDRWQTRRAAAGDAPGEAVLNVSANSYSSSLRPMAERHVRADPRSVVIDTQSVPVVTVRDVVREEQIDPATCLLKIDTQGHERAVLDGAGPLLDDLAAVQLELSFVELYEGQELYDDLVAAMRSRGFVLWSLETGMSDATGRLLQCDGLFVKEERDV